MGKPSSDYGHMAIYRKLITKVADTTVLLTSLGKTFFAWRFILNENSLFWLTISCHLSFMFLCFVLKYLHKN